MRGRIDVKTQLILFLCFAIGLATSEISSAEGYTGPNQDEAPPITVSVLGMALAPNAGGQKAYSLKLHRDGHEIHGFANTYLTTGSTPLAGGGYDYRISACDERCFWQFYIQTGGGLSTAGPFFQLSWGMQIPFIPLWLPTPTPRFVPRLRVEFTTQCFATSSRLITWSYPLWTGLAVSF